MKVVLFCGGLGMRLREFSDTIPKPMVNIGYRPILWHVMKYYAHYGHKDFILCLGYKADAIKRYFLEYNECITNNFVLSNGGKSVKLLNSDIHDWNLTFVDTGTMSNIGQRLRAVRDLLREDEVFLANYTDGLTDLPLEEHVQNFVASGKTASFLCVKPSQTFHVASMNGGNLVTGIQHVTKTGLRMNGGYFVLRREIFDYMQEGEELVEEPFQRLIAEQQLMGYPYDGFWACMDTFKELQKLEDLFNRNEAPWEIWKQGSNGKRHA
jgi:glucose-1-phosphate cytidylyltransferase